MAHQRTISIYSYVKRKHVLVSFMYLTIGLTALYVTYSHKKLSSVKSQFAITLSRPKLTLRQFKELLVKNSSITGDSVIPKILLWTPFFGTYENSYYGRLSRVLKKCPVECQVTTDKAQLGTSEALIFHVRDLHAVPLPPFHDPDQIWVFFNKEAPTHTGDIKKYKNVFNWTMTYRHDSDIYSPYGQLTNLNDNTRYQYDNDHNQKLLPKNPYQKSSYLTESKKLELISKPKLGAWVVSNCHTLSNRESFIAELQEYIPIDIFGNCGSFQCPTSDSHECYTSISSMYKFYFSFENSLCSEYVTEKFFDALHYDMIPVVYGRADYSQLAPNDSYIDTSLFSSSKQLAEYLIMLAENSDEYLKYFRWKDMHKVEYAKGWCNLCKKLKDFNRDTGHRKTYGSIDAWWNNNPVTGDAGEESQLEPVCVKPREFRNEGFLNRLTRMFIKKEVKLA